MIRGTMHGSRQDAMIECFVTYYLMRPVWFEYLKSDMQSGTNILEKSLFAQLACVEFLAAVRARCILYDKIFEAFQFLCNSDTLNGEKSGLAWCALDMAGPTQQLKAALEEMVKDGQYLMKLERANIFNLDDTKAQEQLDEWDELMLERTREVHVKEEVAETERDVSVRRWLRDELYRSNDADVQKTDELCAEAMQCFAVTALAELKKIAKDYIDNGKYTPENATAFMREILVGTCRNNDPAKRLFGKCDEVVRSTPNLSLSNAGGVVACGELDVFGPEGEFSAMHPYVSESFMYMVTHDQVWYQAFHTLTKDQQELQTQLSRSENARVALIKIEVEYEERVRYHRQRDKIPTTAVQLDRATAQLSDNATCALYKNQVRFRTLGNGWKKEPPAILKGVFNFHIAWTCRGKLPPTWS